jgi:hypothetical protein
VVSGVGVGAGAGADAEAEAEAEAGVVPVAGRAELTTAVVDDPVSNN